MKKQRPRRGNGRAHGRRPRLASRRRFGRRRDLPRARRARVGGGAPTSRRRPTRARARRASGGVEVAGSSIFLTVRPGRTSRDTHHRLGHLRVIRIVLGRGIGGHRCGTRGRPKASLFPPLLRARRRSLRARYGWRLAAAGGSRKKIAVCIASRTINCSDDRSRDRPAATGLPLIRVFNFNRRSSGFFSVIPRTDRRVTYHSRLFHTAGRAPRTSRPPSHPSTLLSSTG